MARIIVYPVNPSAFPTARIEVEYTFDSNNVVLIFIRSVFRQEFGTSQNTYRMSSASLFPSNGMERRDVRYTEDCSEVGTLDMLN